MKLKAGNVEFVVVKEEKETVDIRYSHDPRKTIYTIKKNDLASASDWKPTETEEAPKKEVEEDYGLLGWFGV